MLIFPTGNCEIMKFLSINLSYYVIYGNNKTAAAEIAETAHTK